MFVLFFDKAKVGVPTLGDFVQSFNFTLFRISHYEHHVEAHPGFKRTSSSLAVETIKLSPFARLKHIACTARVRVTDEDIED